MRTGYAGPSGGFGEEAFSLYQKGRELVPCELPPAIRRVVEAVGKATVDRGLVPAENIIRGEFRETYEALYEHAGKVRIVDAFMHSGHYSAGTLIEGRDIKEVWGTQEILDECAPFLNLHFPRARPVASESLILAIQSMKGDRLAGIAVIGLQKILVHAGLEVLFQDILPNNMTLYYVLAGQGEAAKSEQDVTEIILTLEKDRPFWLNKVTEVLKSFDRNLTNIFRVPNRKGGYWFVLAMMGHIEDPKVQDCLAGLEKQIPGTKVTVLGCHAAIPFRTNSREWQNRERADQEEQEGVSAP